MSQRSGSRRPPFLAGGEATPSKLPVATASKPSTAQKGPEIVKDPLTNPGPQPIQEQALGTPEEPLPKRAKKDGPVLPVPKPPASATPVHHLYAKHGYLHATEEECTSWVGASLEETAESVSKCVAEAFIRQASHLKEIRSMVAANAKLSKENKVLRFQNVEDKRSLAITYKQQLETETASLKSDLKSLSSEKVALTKSLKEAEEREAELVKKHVEELEKLKKQLGAVQTDHDTIVETAQVEFMKGFIRKIPDFDWSRLGPGNAEFADSLRKDIEEEDAKKAEEARLKSSTANPDGVAS